VTLLHLDLGGRPLEYEFIRVGDKHAPTLVFLHEGLGSLSLWKDFPQKLAAASGCDAMVYSRFGYGASAPLLAPREPQFMHEEALSVLPALLDRLDIENPILFGHSDGASIALIHAASAGRAVRGLILLAPHIMVEELCVHSIAAAKQAYATGNVREKLARYHADPGAAFYGWCDIWLDQRFRDWNIEEHVEKVACPILAIQGFDDEYGTMEQIDRIAKALPGTQLLKLQSCGHSPHRDQPDEVITAAIRHIAALGHRRSAE
jgi:pimeloyl-ACP methyl ester carboxylesterase